MSMQNINCKNPLMHTCEMLSVMISFVYILEKAYVKLLIVLNFTI